MVALLKIFALYHLVAELSDLNAIPKGSPNPFFRIGRPFVFWFLECCRLQSFLEIAEFSGDSPVLHAGSNPPRPSAVDYDTLSTKRRYFLTEMLLLFEDCRVVWSSFWQCCHPSCKWPPGNSRCLFKVEHTYIPSPFTLHNIIQNRNYLLFSIVFYYMFLCLSP